MKLPPRSVRRALVVAPHADDEAIGAYALMTHLRRCGARLWVMVVTDGAASHPGSTRWPPARLARQRRLETRRAMRTLGIPPSRIRFLDLPDGRLPLDRPLLARTIGCAMRRLPPPDLIVGPIAHDAHADHRAVAAALSRHRARYRLGYRVWPLGRESGAAVRLPLDGRAMAVKRRVVRSYRTQAGLIDDSPTGMAMRAHHLRRFAGPCERFSVLR